jgi:hypothetical protein
MNHLDYRMYRSLAAKLQKDWKGGTKQEYLAMDWIAAKIFDYLRINGYIDATDPAPHPKQPEMPMEPKNKLIGEFDEGPSL